MAVQIHRSFADRTQGPVCSLLHEIAAIGGVRFNDRQEVEEGRSWLFLPMHDRPSHHGKGRASNELPFIGRELIDQFPPGIRIDEEIGDAVVSAERI